MARLKFPKDKPKHISIRISPGHADRDGNPYLIRGILFRKRRRKNDSVNTEYYSGLAENVEGAMLRLRDTITEI